MIGDEKREPGGLYLGWIGKIKLLACNSLTEYIAETTNMQRTKSHQP